MNFGLAFSKGLGSTFSEGPDPGPLYKNCRMIVENECYKDVFLKVTHIEKAPSNETQALTKSTNKGIWVVSTSNHFFIRGS